MIPSALLQWYQQHARDLPWRHTQDPYRIWLSEIMLQQTQVKTVLPRYEAWFQRFPSIQALASSDVNDVLKQWEGLGYYRRARFLHAAAQQIMDQHRGVFPQDFADILALPGIGRSTAGAIASFCFAQATPILDANVKRVFSSWNNRQYNDKELWHIAETWMQTISTPDMWNQALMELGATHCQAKKRDCQACPIATWCLSAGEPVVASKKSVKVLDVHWQVELFTCKQQGIWLQQRPDSGIWAGLWTPPITVFSKKPKQEPTLIHSLTHRRIHLYLKHRASLPTGTGEWVQSTHDVAMPTGIHRLLQA
ncbi:MAG: A/G-specific adenine glycosylase [Ghiorsea sp.]